jgi:hypothetical protein
MSKDLSGNYYQRLHALDVTTGAEEFGGPTLVAANFPNNGGGVTFNAEQYAERAALLVWSGNIYMGWTSHCDHTPYTGWIMAYSESTLQQTAVLNVTPNGRQGSVWMGGAGIASDGEYLYVLDANGIFDTKLNAEGFPVKGDFGNAMIQFLPATNGQLEIVDYFTMWNTTAESKADTDFGSGGILILPTMTDANGNQQNLAVGAGKDSNLYMVNCANLGKFNPTEDNIYQEIDGALPGGIYGMPAYFNGSLYYAPNGYNLLQFSFSQALLNPAPASESGVVFPSPGSTPSVSADGTENGIVWAIEHSKPQNILHAYNAGNLQNELYNSSQAGKRDEFGEASQYGTPMIVNGKVYVGTFRGVTAFGLLSDRPR